MDNTKYISLTEICTGHRIDYSFIRSLNEYGLVEIYQMEEHEVINRENLEELEKMLRLHYDLEINLEGIDAIQNILHRITHLQEEIRVLKNRLNRFEDPE